MGQLLKRTGLIVILMGVWGPAWAGVVLNGTYKGEIGTVDFRTDATGRVTGRFRDGEACNFYAGRPIVDGEFEGKVLVATVTLCQTGPACDERAYNVLAFYNVSEGVLTANVKLEAGCESAALKSSRLVLHLDPDSEGKAASAPALPPGKRKPARVDPDECLDSLKRGAKLLEQRAYAGASQSFRQGLVCNDRNWAAHLGVGVAELRLGHLDDALASLEKARDLSQAMKQEDAGVHYNLACAHARRNDRRNALKSLRKAVELGWASPEVMSTDLDLLSLREDAEFKELLERTLDRARREQKENAKKGDTL
jgi:tetratricopeptide (TPR) repeat protein